MIQSNRSRQTAKRLLICAAVALTTAFGTVATAEEQGEMRRISINELVHRNDYTEVSPTAKPTTAKISLSITPAFGKGSISAGEPLVARVVLKNNTDGTVETQVGWSHPIAQFEVKDAQGKVLASTPTPKFHTGEGITGIFTVEPGRERSLYCVPSGLYQFTKPGNYTVSVRIYLDLDTYVQAQTPIHVTAYNRKRLIERCEELYAQPPAFENESIDNITRTALYSVRDDVVLPYLDLLARELPYKEPFLAIREIDTPRARKLIASLAARTDDVGKLAREAQLASVDPMSEIAWK